ncbi:hypothetical protein [Nocardia grenadensis]|uniref:hypothetical protein n=1 Tax=Nocardia grenadensis TaxID=931537 RepID=UPI0007A519F2|nr:hypothetical protein [Nocardia grenadensis]
MADQFWAEPDKLHAVAPEYDRIGAAASEIMQRLREAVHLTGVPWGTDDTGRAFAETYCPDEQQALRDLDDLVRALNRRGDELRAVTAVFEGGDLASARDIARTGAVPDIRETGQPAIVRKSDPTALVTGPSTVTGSQHPAEYPAGVDPLPQPAHRVGEHTPTGSSADRLHGHADAGAALDGSAAGRASGGSVDAASAGARYPENHSHGAPAQPAPLDRTQRTGRTTRPKLEATGVGRGDSGARGGHRTAIVPADSSTSTTASAGRGKSSPWSTTTGTRMPVSAPAVSEPPPRLPTPPTPPRPGRTARPARADVQEPAESLADRLTMELAERHGVRAFGFAAPGISGEVLIEVASAVDELMTRYPVIRLSAIGFGELAGTGPVEFDGYPDCPRITLSLQAATEPATLRQTITAAEHAGLLAAGCAERPLYSLIARELGALLDSTGDLRARRNAQRALIAAYLSGVDPYERYSLRRTVTGYRRWRDQLPGRSFRGSQLDPAAALSEAFTGVVLAPDRAAPATKVLFELLVSSADLRPADAGRSRSRLQS